MTFNYWGFKFLKSNLYILKLKFYYNYKWERETDTKRNYQWKGILYIIDIWTHFNKEKFWPYLKYLTLLMWYNLFSKNQEAPTMIVSPQVSRYIPKSGLCFVKEKSSRNWQSKIDKKTDNSEFRILVFLFDSNLNYIPYSFEVFRPLKANILSPLRVISEKYLLRKYHRPGSIFRV